MERCHMIVRVEHEIVTVNITVERLTAEQGDFSQSFVDMLKLLMHSINFFQHSVSFPLLILAFRKLLLHFIAPFFHFREERLF